MLYDAIAEILVPGTIEALRMDRLPPDQVLPVDVSCATTPGTGPEWAYGTDEPEWWHTGLLFLARAEEPLPAYTVILAIRDALTPFRPGDHGIHGDERIYRISPGSPWSYAQDERERPIVGLRAEVWHRTA